jgi:predicted double-glycine peptidase
MRPARAFVPETPDDEARFTARRSAVARPIQRPLVVTPDGKLDRRSQRWLERQQERHSSLPPAAESWEANDGTTLALPDVYGSLSRPEHEPDGVNTGAQRAITPFMPNAALEVAAQNKTTAPPVIIAGGTLAPLPRVAPTPPLLRITLMKRVMITLLALAFLISSAQIAAHNPALAQEGWQALANAVAFTQQQQAYAIRTTGVAANVQAFTQGKRVDLYNSVDQFNQWWGSACSAAVLAEVLSAYGVPNATIGRMIDELGSDISTRYGLMTYAGFNKVAQKHGFRADIYVDRHLTYHQMQYLTNTLGLPVIVNVRATTGYYHYLSGGHFLVMTGGDSKSIRLVDSSLYYIKSLSLSTFNWMFRQRTVVIVPADYHYDLPAS